MRAKDGDVGRTEAWLWKRLKGAQNYNILRPRLLQQQKSFDQMTLEKVLCLSTVGGRVYWSWVNEIMKYKEIVKYMILYSREVIILN